MALSGQFLNSLACFIVINDCKFKQYVLFRLAAEEWQTPKCGDAHDPLNSNSNKRNANANDCGDEFYSGVETTPCASPGIGTRMSVSSSFWIPTIPTFCRNLPFWLMFGIFLEKRNPSRNNITPRIDSSKYLPLKRLLSSDRNLPSRISMKSLILQTYLWQTVWWFGSIHQNLKSSKI